MAITDRSNAPGYQRSEADVRAIFELTEVLRDGIVEYQVRVILKVSNQLVEFFADGPG